MRITITLVTLTAIALGVVHFAHATVCETQCDQYTNRCVTRCHH